MKLTEALKVLQSAPAQGQPFELVLACGFTPLHLETFLGAHLQKRLTSRSVKIRNGLYADVVGTLEAAAAQAPHALVLALEWADLDPRLGYRSAGSWNSVSEIIASVRLMLSRIEEALHRLPASLPVAISLPTLDLPSPLFHTPGWQIGLAELELQKSLLEFAASLAARRNCSIVHPGRLQHRSPAAERYDFKADLQTGLPYKLPHASLLGEIIARLLVPPTPKKGLITDLDDTLWFGIVGEVGPENVSWDLASHRQLHGLYQKVLSTLATEGVLLAIASKNDPALAGQALQRPDLLVRPEQIFPLEISWNAKSGAIQRILEAWNIGADSVVFVDDSPMELAEVASAHPGIECVLFPKDDLRAGFELLDRLRDWFGKPRLSEEDAFRLDSIRQNTSFRQAQGGSASEDFLEQAGAVVTFDFENTAADARALELINKTNQFNLNGLRLDDAGWQQLLALNESVSATISYQDRFGPLGKIAVLAGRKLDHTVVLDHWVLSCRAFARRIEHQCLQVIFDRYDDVDTIQFAFAPTSKNGPVRDFFASLLSDSEHQPVAISRASFQERCPRLYHRVVGSQMPERV